MKCHSINSYTRLNFLKLTICTQNTVFENQEKVSFNIASEASYVYILSGQKLMKNAKNSQYWRLLENMKLAGKQCYQTGHFKKDIDGKWQNWKILRHFGWFSNTVLFTQNSNFKITFYNFLIQLNFCDIWLNVGRTKGENSNYPW